MTLAIDTILENRYRIDRLIGQGGMGAIYQGYDSNLDVDVAIKENFFQTPQSIHQFQQEARILAKLHHAALPRVMYHFSMAGQQYLVMDYIEGEDLWQMIKRLKQPLAEAQAVRYIMQICDAVQYLHEQQPPIIHRDIKPQNIKVTPKGQAVLVDFGIAKVAEQGALTSTGARGVTPGFSPPEQYSGEGTSARSDIYALGATLYALLTAEKPPDSISLLTGKVKFDTLGPPKFNISEPLLQAIRHAMQPLESNRPASVVDWQAELTGQVAPPPMPVEPRQTVMAEVKTVVPTEILPEPTVIETQGTFSQSPTVVETQSVASQSPTVVETQATDLRFPTEVSPPPPAASSSNMGMWLGVGAVVVIVIGFIMFMMSGGGGSKVTVVTATPEPPTDIPVANIKGKISLWYTYPMGSHEQQTLVKLVRNAKKQYPDLDVVMTPNSLDNIWNKWTYEVALGKGPDMFLAPNDLLGDVVRAKAVLNLDKYLVGRLEQVYPLGVQGMKINGVLYGIPESTKAVALYYNKSKVVTPPKTTDELLEAVKRGSPMTFFIGAYHMFGWSGSFGGELMDKDDKCIADKGGWAESLQYLLDLKAAGARFESDYGKAETPFILGQTAFFVNGPWALIDYKNVLGDKLGVVPLPKGIADSNPINGIDGFYINPNSQNIDAAIGLALFLTNKDSAQIFTAEGTHIPIRRDVDPNDPLIAAFAEASAKGFPRPHTKYFGNFWEPFDGLYLKVLQGTSKPVDAVKEACTAMNRANGK